MAIRNTMATLALVCAVICAPVACDREDDVGTPCELVGATASHPLLGVQLRGDAPDCASAVCLRYARFDATAPSQCTRPCGATADCPGARPGCPGGFACAVGQTLGAFQCCRLCVCRDLLAEPDLDPASEICADKETRCTGR